MTIINEEEAKALRQLFEYHVVMDIIYDPGFELDIKTLKDIMVKIGIDGNWINKGIQDGSKVSI